MSTTTAERATLDVAEAAARLGLSRQTAYRMVARDDALAGIPVIRAGARVLIPREPLERLLAGEAAVDREVMEA